MVSVLILFISNNDIVDTPLKIMCLGHKQGCMFSRLWLNLKPLALEGARLLEVLTTGRLCQSSVTRGLGWRTLVDMWWLLW